MIKVLGIKRILILVFLIAINVALAAGVYAYMVPELAKQQRQLRGVRGNISTVQADIDKMQIEFEQLEAQQAKFDRLKARGFFSDQGRRQAERIFEKIQDEARVISAIASVQPGSVEENEEAVKAEHKILVSPVKIKVEAISDTDVFRYLYLIQKFFPGHLTFESITLERSAEISNTILRSIAGGNNPELVQANIDMLWRTMIPADRVIESQAGEESSRRSSRRR